MKILNTLNFLIIFFYSQALLASNSYKCNVKEATSLENNGKLEETVITKSYINLEFIIDKATGRIIGPDSLSNHDNSESGNPKILDVGSTKQSFKVITIFSPYTKVAYIEVREFEKGSLKPFIYTYAGNVYSGVCTAY